MKEYLLNREPFPPKHEVLHRQTVSEGKAIRYDRVYIEGHHVHLGELIQGWRGNETIVYEEIQGDIHKIIKDNETRKRLQRR